MPMVPLYVTLLNTFIFTATGAHSYKKALSFKVSKFQGSSARERARASLIASNSSARMPAESGSRWLENAGPSRPFSSPTSPGRPVNPLGKQLHRGNWGVLDVKTRVAYGGAHLSQCNWFLRGLAGRPPSTGHEKGRDVPAFFFLCKRRPAGIRTLGFEARGKTGARDPGVGIEDPLTSTMK